MSTCNDWLRFLTVQVLEGSLGSTTQLCRGGKFPLRREPRGLRLLQPPEPLLWGDSSALTPWRWDQNGPEIRVSEGCRSGDGFQCGALCFERGGCSLNDTFAHQQIGGTRRLRSKLDWAVLVAVGGGVWEVTSDDCIYVTGP